MPWLHSLFGNAAAVASGVAATLRAQGRDDVRVVAQAGDGGTVDIGLGCLSGMFERNDDVLFVCYDNQGYMNTGVQRSGATPAAASTANTRPVGTRFGNAFGTGKSLPVIAMAHEIPYVATATVADLHDLEAKVTKAMSMHGARYLHVLVPCPLGWGTTSADTIRVARLATESGSSRSSRPSDGEITAVHRIRRQVPVEDYLQLQTRFAHLFGDDGRPDVVAAAATPGRPLDRPLRPARGDTDDHRPALRHHPRPRLEQRRPDRLLAHRARRVRRPHCALRPRLPGRRGRPRLALPRRVRRRRLRGGLARDHGRSTRSPP